MHSPASWRVKFTVKTDIVACRYWMLRPCADTHSRWVPAMRWISSDRRLSEGWRGLYLFWSADMTPRTWSSRRGERADAVFESRRENLQRGPFTFPLLQGLEGEHEGDQGSLRPGNPAGESGEFMCGVGTCIHPAFGKVESQKDSKNNRTEQRYFLILASAVDENRKVFSRCWSPQTKEKTQIFIHFYFFLQFSRLDRLWTQGPQSFKDQQYKDYSMEYDIKDETKKKNMCRNVIYHANVELP